MIRFWLWMAMGVLLGNGASAASGALIPAGASWSYQAMTVGMPPAGWMEPAFDDQAWAVGTAGFSVGLYGYDAAATAIPVSIQGMPVRGLLMRQRWVLEEPESVERLTLRVDYEDGLVGWLNGEEVIRRGIPPGQPVSGNEVPAPRFLGEVELIDLTPFRERLVAGTNVLSLMVLDATAFSATLFAWAELRANFIRGPLVQNVSSNAATIFWGTHGPEAAWVEVAPVGRPELLSVLSVGRGTNSELALAGLEAGTRYGYRVGWDGAKRRVWSTAAEFMTAKGSGDLDFLVFGDSGSGALAQHAVAAAMAKEEADLVLHTGDISYPVFTAGQVDLRCFSVYEPLMRRIPFYFTVGNHDFYDGDTAYLEAFRLPTNSVTGTEHYYSFDHGDAHFVSLFVPWVGVSQLGTILPDGNRSAPYRWLTNDLARSDKPWKVVFFHQPVKTSGPHIFDDYDADGKPDIEALREALLPALAQGGVQLAFMGHDHAWERFAPTNGVHLVVTGGGGGVLYPMYRRDPASAQFVQRHHFVRCKVRGDELNVEAVDPAGGVFDRFTVRRAGSRAVSDRLTSKWVPAESLAGMTGNGDGNFVGEKFGLIGEGAHGVSGRAASLGRIVVNHDGQWVHVGLRDAMLWPGQTLMLFVGNPAVAGVAGCQGVGTLRGHALAGLDLRFQGFQPGWVFLLGDELADGTFPGFRRVGDPVAFGQGVFRMDGELSPVEGAWLRQFNRSPETLGVVGEENADFMVVSLRRAVVEAERVGSTLQFAGVVVTPVLGPTGIRVELDSAFLGAGLTGGEDNGWRLEPWSVSLTDVPDVDRDGDGLSEEQELEWGTDPDHPDTDRDGLPDGWETGHQLDPRSDRGDDGGDGDPDGDGYGNREEFASGTDPRDGAPTLRLGATRQGGRLKLLWRTTVGREYDVEVATGLPGRFEPAGLPGFPRRAVGTNEVAILDAPTPGVGGRWFRIRER